MDEAIAAHLKRLGDAVRATAIPEDAKRTALGCLRQRPAQDARARQTNESRHDDAITRLVQVRIRHLTVGGTAPGRKSWPPASPRASVACTSGWACRSWR